jgi:hypothetical protein
MGPLGSAKLFDARLSLPHRLYVHVARKIPSEEHFQARNTPRLGPTWEFISVPGSDALVSVTAELRSTFSGVSPASVRT